jgi:spermidine/putrescine transport system permease protein
MKLSKKSGSVLLLPLAIVLLCTIAIPAGIFFVYSFYDFELLEPQPAFHLAHYGEVFSNEIYRTLAWKTIQIAVPTTVICVAAGFALAYFINDCRGKTRSVLIGLVVASMLASYLARIYAWRTLLGERGTVSSLLSSIGLGHGLTDGLLFSRAGVIIGQVNFLLPFATLVIFAGLSGISPQLRVAGRDLGARRSTVLARITVPLVGPALLAAITFTFFLSAGDYLTPVLLGGPDGTTIGASIANQLQTTGNYPLGAALSFVLLAGFALIYAAVRFSMKASGWLPRGAKEVRI